MWLPILGGDERAVVASASEMFAGIDVPQFWDGETRLGREIGRGLGVDGWVAWDIYLFYPPEAVWTDAGPPAPEAVLAQAAGVVVGAKGTLPPRGDASELPPELRARVDVVGKQEELTELLAQVAARLAK